MQLFSSYPTDNVLASFAGNMKLNLTIIEGRLLKSIDDPLSRAHDRILRPHALITDLDGSENIVFLPS